jgi:macrolide transport system ATP-binding/permease protein
MDALYRDLRYSIRMLLKDPGFMAVAVMTFALGLGANAAIFSVVNAFLFRPLAVKNPDQLVVLASKDDRLEFPHYLSYADYVDYRDKAGVFSDVIAFAPSPANLSHEGRADRIWSELVTANYFSMLGVEPLLGRYFLPDEDHGAGAHPVVVLSYGFWQSRFHGDPSVVGQELSINGHGFTIVGVTAKGFPGTQPFLDINVYVPLTMLEEIRPGSGNMLTERDDQWLRVMARLNPGATIGQAKGAVNLLARDLEREYPKTNKGVTVIVVPEVNARPDVGVSGFLPPLAIIFMLLAGLVLLITCANLSSMLLAKAMSRHKEFAIRGALGASRIQLMRQLLAESILLALLGGAVGIVLAYAITAVVSSVTLPGDDLFRLSNVSPDLRVFGFTFLLALLAGIIATLTPASRASRLDLNEALKEGGRSGSETSAGNRFRSILVVLQVAVSIFVVNCAGLFIRSSMNAEKIDLGFRTENVLLVSLDVGLQGYDEARGKQFYSKLIDRVGTLPGIRSASLAHLYPFSTNGSEFIDVFAEGYVPISGSDAVSVACNEVGPDYFETDGISLAEGQGFTKQDIESSPKVAVVSESMGRRFWPGQDPVGKWIIAGERNGPHLRIIGVAKDSKFISLGQEVRPFLYLPLTQTYRSSVTLQVYTSGAPLGFVPSITEAVHDLDGQMSLFGIVTMQTHIHDGIALMPQRSGAWIVSVFGVLGLILTMVGIYGIISYSVSQRRQELGIRMALGSQPSDILKRVVMGAITLTGIGTVMGLVLSLAAGRFLSGLLYGVKATDPVSLICSIVLMATVALLASYLPARRASHTDPLLALRGD